MAFQKLPDPGTQEDGGAGAPASSSWGWAVVLGILFLGTMVQARPKEPSQPEPAERTSLLVMTYNIQQANDGDAQKSYERQLALMREVSPDIIPSRSLTRPASRSTTMTMSVTLRTSSVITPILDPPPSRAHMERPSCRDTP